MAASHVKPIFRENIDKNLSEENLVENANRLRGQGKSVFDLQVTNDQTSVEKDKYVFINIFNGHASIVVADKELFDTILFSPVWGQMLDGPNLVFREDFEAVKKMAPIPLQQYHVSLDDSGSNYILTRNLYDMPWLKKSRSFYVGESAMPYSYLDLLCLTVVPSRYRLIVDDCLEFAKRFAKEIAVRENDVRERKIQALFRTFSVSEHYASMITDQAPPNGPKGGLSTGIPYFASSREEIPFCSVF